MNSKRFEGMIIEPIRENILTDGNIRRLVMLINNELDAVVSEQRERVEAVEEELNEIRRRLDRLWLAVETSDMDISDILPRIREHKDRQRSWNWLPKRSGPSWQCAWQDWGTRQPSPPTRRRCEST